MIKIGLTGGIGMGKSATAAMFADAGLPVWDADEAVHRLYQAGGLGGPALSVHFPLSVKGDGSVDRQKLGVHLAENPEDWELLNRIIHPLVANDRAAFLSEAAKKKSPAVVLDIPLLFETGGESHVDVVVVCSADEKVRRARVLAREGMTEEKYGAITAQQMSDEDKRLRADFIVETDKGFDHARQQVRDILMILFPVESSDDPS